MKALVAYYSYSGTTRIAAEQIHQLAGGDIFEIIAETPYPEDFNEVVEQARKEIAEGYKPKLQNDPPDISEYDAVIVGTPNWCSTIAPPLATFLASQDFTGKRLLTFVTHGTGGLGRCMSDIKQLCPTAQVEDGFDANFMENANDWLSSLGII